MKKTIVLLGVLFLGGTLGFAQEVKHTEQEKQVIARYQQVIKSMEDFQQFDYYYYIYAMKNLVNKESIEFLEVHKGVREYVGSADRSAKDYNGYLSYYYTRMEELRARKMALSAQDKAVLTQYSKRPATRKRMLADKAEYDIYEDIVYETIKEEITSQSGACLDLVRDLRKQASEGKIDRSITAKYKKVLNCQNQLSSRLDQARLQDYLEMPVSRNAEPYYMPLTEWAK